MDLEINILMERDRKRKTIFMRYHPYVESKRNMKTLTDIENRLVVAKEGRTRSLG